MEDMVDNVLALLGELCTAVPATANNLKLVTIDDKNMKDDDTEIE